MTELKRRGRISPTSKKRLDELAERPPIRRAVFERDGGCLLAYGRPLSLEGRNWGPCRGVLTPHHLLKASHGGAYSEDNLVCLCETHNSAVEDHPVDAHQIGLMIFSWEGK